MFSHVQPDRVLQAKGYAEGAGDSLAGGLKKNVAKVTGNEAKEAEGKSWFSFCAFQAFATVTESKC